MDILQLVIRPFPRLEITLCLIRLKHIIALSKESYAAGGWLAEDSVLEELIDAGTLN